MFRLRNFGNRQDVSRREHTTPRRAAEGFASGSGRRRFFSLVMAVIVAASGMSLHLFAGVIASLGLGAVLSEPSYAVKIGETDKGDDILLDEVRFILNHKGFDFNGGYFELSGKKLKDVEVFVYINGEAQSIGTRAINTDNLVTIKLNQQEVSDFSGELIVEGTRVDFNIGAFPNLQTADRGAVVKGGTPPDNTITFTGNNLNNITGTIKATYGAGTDIADLTTAGTSPAVTATSIKLTDPTSPGRKGYQSIYISRVDSATPLLPKIKVEYQYINAFRILEPMDTGNVTMYPNTGSKGDELYIESKTFNHANTYEVYFLKNIDGSDKPSEINKAEVISLGTDIEGTEDNKGDILTVKVPNHVSFEPGSYYVLLTKVQNKQIIAETFVKTADGNNDVFIVIQAAYSPKIEAIHPSKGPDTGSDVEIKGKNIITLNIPDLEYVGKATPSYTSAEGETKLSMDYQNDSGGFKYKGKAVDVSRTINMIIAKPVKFKPGDNYISYGAQDKFIITTQAVTDAEAQPKRDVIVEISTTITEKTGSPAKKYIFKQQVHLKNGYEFIPSTYTPNVESVTPERIQMEKTQLDSVDLYKSHNKILLSIKGDKFFVYRYYDDAGNPIARRPEIYIKQDDSNTLLTSYQIGFLPNHKGTDGLPNVIMYSTGSDSTDPKKELAGKHFKMTVLDKNGREVDGTEGNQLGQNIILELPADFVIKQLGHMHIQVVNPLRGKNDTMGDSEVFSNRIEFVTAPDSPVIEKVEPNVVTVDGGEDVVLTGSNIASDAKLYIDGNEVKSFTRELDSTGNKILLKFKAPKNREAITQLLVQNPNGGLAVTDFTFIRSFDADPTIASFNPPMGTRDTVVVVSGDNYIKPDPTAITQRGVDAYRLIGTRILLDGQDVDTFKKVSGEIVFTAYTSPNAEILIKEDAGVAVFSKLAENATVTYREGAFTRVAALGKDANGNPMIIAGDSSYSIVYDKVNSGGGVKKFRALDKEGNSLGEAVLTFEADSSDVAKGTTTVAVKKSDGSEIVKFTAEHDNHVVRIGVGEDGAPAVHLANYAESISFRDNITNMDTDPSVRYTLSYNFRGEAVLTNGKDKKYVLVATGSPVQIKGVSETGATVSITQHAGGIGIDGTPIYMITPYAEDAGVIVGHRSKVHSRTQVIFEVPELHSGRGYKDLVVINPDTKRASKVGEEGFFYIPQASSKPVISTVLPKKGSVDGGYYVTISGSDFADDARVFVDGVEVPKEDTLVALNGKSIVIRMVATEKKLSEDYGVDSMTVPVVVLNQDGGTASKKDGFTYIIPKSNPVITKIIPDKGSSNGEEIVEISGYEFRFYEPYTNVVGDSDYQNGDKHEDIFPNAVWDHLFDPINQKKLLKLVKMVNFLHGDKAENIFAETDWSEVLPSAPIDYPALVGDLKTLYAAGQTGSTEFQTKFDQVYLELSGKSPIVPKKIFNHPFYSVYYESSIFPKVYFGENEAKIVEFSKGYIKVLTPSHKPGEVGVYVINNDSGVSNKVKYTYESTKPVIHQLLPSFGKRGGNEPKEIFGKQLYPAKPVYGYVTDNGTSLIGASGGAYGALERIEDLNVIVRFGEIDNTKIPRIEENSGLVNDNRTTVHLEGGLTFQYFGDQKKFKLTINERNTIFTREFRYDPEDVPSEDGAIFVPVGMLKDASGNYYVPTGLTAFSEFTNNPTTYKNPYEYIRIYLDDRRMFVERGYAPKTIYENDTHVTVFTPSYHSIGKVPMTYFNPDGGVISKPFEYTNPASQPKILRVEPQTLSHDETKWLVESSVDGGIDIEIIGTDLRPGITVTIGDKPAKVKELGNKNVDGKSYDLVVLTVPKGTNEEMGRLYPIILKNEDSGLATSNNVKDLIGPNHGGKTLPFYFVYRKPLSFPKIGAVLPKYTSVAGGNSMVITGTDFRPGCYVIIGTRAGIPIYSGVLSDLGTKITFRTPTNMSLGVKDIQVLNTDYGTALEKGAIHVVSAPKLSGEFYGETGKEINRIHVTGGQVITVKGSNFQEGATVFFGGEWVEAKQNPENKPGADEGLYVDDKLYTVKNGAKATAVVFVDENTLKVTTPAVKKEGEISVVVLNKDGGISDDGAKLDFRVPIPSDPTGLKATIVDDRYIKLYDYVSDGAKYFEIYAYIGHKTNSQLIGNKYQDFTYLGVTEVEPYKIIDLPGWEKMKSADRAVFVVKAVNKFGQSGYSNLAHIDQQEFKNVKELGPEDLDGKVGIKDGKDYEHRNQRGVSEIRLSPNPEKLLHHIDLSGKLRADTKLRKISVPEELVRGMPSVLSVSYGDTMVHFATTALNTAVFRQMDLYEDVYGNWTEEREVNAPMPSFRGKKALTKAYKVSFGVSSDEDDRGVTELERDFEYAIRVPDHAKNAGRTEMYRYDAKKGKYVRVDAVYDDATRFLRYKGKGGGYFILMEELR